MPRAVQRPSDPTVLGEAESRTPHQPKQLLPPHNVNSAACSAWLVVQDIPSCKACVNLTAPDAGLGLAMEAQDKAWVAVPLPAD